MDIDGFYRLQTNRIESAEVTKQILDGSKGPGKGTISTVKYIIKDISEVTPDGVSIQFKSQDEEIQKEQEKAEKQSEEPQKKSITDFTVMKKYIKSKPVIIEFQEKNKYGQTINKEVLEVNEYKMA
jgi:hypothetical protein